MAERRIGTTHPPEKIVRFPDGSAVGSQAQIYWVERPYSVMVKIIRADGEELPMHLSIGELDMLCGLGLYFLEKAEKEGDARKLGILHFLSTHRHEER